MKTYLSIVFAILCIAAMVVLYPHAQTANTFCDASRGSVENIFGCNKRG